jgi:hypothetical protein
MEGNHDFGDEYPPLHPNCRCAIVGQSTVSADEIANENAPEGDSVEVAAPVEVAPIEIAQPQLNAPEKPFDYFTDKWSSINNDAIALANELGVPVDGRFATKTAGDLYMQSIWATQKFDALPTIVDNQQYDSLAKSGWQPIYRGISDKNAETVQSYVDAYKTGDAFAGGGLFGNGTYASVSEETANTFTKFDGSGIERPFGQRLDLLLHPDARVGTYEEITNGAQSYRKEMQTTMKEIQEKFGLGQFPMYHDLESLPADVLREYQNAKDGMNILSDPMRWASAAGYDAVSIANPVIGQTIVDDTYMVILNRGATAVKG